MRDFAPSEVISYSTRRHASLTNRIAAISPLNAGDPEPVLRDDWVAHTTPRWLMFEACHLWLGAPDGWGLYRCSVNSAPHTADTGTGNSFKRPLNGMGCLSRRGFSSTNATAPKDMGPGTLCLLRQVSQRAGFRGIMSTNSTCPMSPPAKSGPSLKCLAAASSTVPLAWIQRRPR